MDDLDAYGCDYVPGPAVVVADHAIRSGDRYVEERDLLRAVVTASSGAVADVQLGVDPGAFYCADQLANLIALRREPGAQALTCGFVHVPPDRGTGPLAASASHLHPRRDNMQQCARVVAAAVRELAEETVECVVLLTAFGPFQGVEDNPTAAFVDAGPNVDAIADLALGGASLRSRRSYPASPAFTVHRYSGSARALTLITAVLPLAASPADALAGRYLDPDATAANFRRVAAIAQQAEPLRAIVSLGVDSGQVLRPARPAFRVETQTRGFHRGPVRACTATDSFQRDLTLARLYLRARDRGDLLLPLDASVRGRAQDPVAISGGASGSS